MAFVIQLIGIFFGIIMIFVSYFYYKRRVFYFHDMLIWMLVWLGLVLTILFPSKLQTIIQPLKILRVMDLITIGGFFISFTLLFVLFARSRQRDRAVEKIVRKLALDEVESE